MSAKTPSERFYAWLTEVIIHYPLITNEKHPPDPSHIEWLPSGPEFDLRRAFRSFLEMAPAEERDRLWDELREWIDDMNAGVLRGREVVRDWAVYLHGGIPDKPAAELLREMIGFDIGAFLRMLRGAYEEMDVVVEPGGETGGQEAEEDTVEADEQDAVPDNVLRLVPLPMTAAVSDGSTEDESRPAPSAAGSDAEATASIDGRRDWTAWAVTGGLGTLTVVAAVATVWFVQTRPQPIEAVDAEVAECRPVAQPVDTAPASEPMLPADAPATSQSRPATAQLDDDTAMVVRGPDGEAWEVSVRSVGQKRTKKARPKRAKKVIERELTADHTLNIEVKKKAVIQWRWQ